MICDPLTKQMDPCKLLEALNTNFWDLRQPLESVLIKRKKQLQRRKTAPAEDEEVADPS